MDVIGGAFDGAVVRTSRCPGWGWIGEYGNEHRLWASPGGSRELYRLQATGLGRPVAYVSAEHTHAQCASCGGLTEASADCRGCGAALPAK